MLFRSTGRFSGSGFEAWAAGLRRDVADAEIRAEMAFAAADEFSVGGPAGASSCAWLWPWLWPWRAVFLPSGLFGSPTSSAAPALPPAAEGRLFQAEPSPSSPSRLMTTVRRFTFSFSTVVGRALGSSGFPLVERRPSGTTASTSSLVGRRILLIRFGSA